MKKYRVSDLAWLASLLLAMQTAPAQTGASAPTAVCNGRVKLEIQSLTREGPGTLSLAATYENLTNLNFRLGVYSGGANGKDTFLVSDSGEMWPKLKAYKGGGGTDGIIFIPGVKMKTTMKFQIRSGGEDARVFHLTNWVHLLAEKGMTGPDESFWCKLEVRSIAPANSAR